MPLRRFRRGLVVGKFSPLHRGHALLIERAIAACDEVLVISYSVPEFAGCERAVRAAWIAELFPQVRALVIDAAELDRHCRRLGIATRPLPPNDAPAQVQREFVGWLCTAVMQTTVDAVFTSEDYGDGFAAALSAYFGTRGHDVDVAHVCVDRARRLVPVSGTAARADPHATRALLPDAVYADFVARIAILGAESSGKTTLARALAERYATTWVPEFGREHWEARGGRLSFDDLLHIGRVQAAREDAAARHAARWLFCDTTPFSTAFYSQYGHGRIDPELAALAQRPYRQVFVCAPDFAFVQDGTRMGAPFSRCQHDWHLDQLRRHGIGFHLLCGPLAQRIGQVETMLATPLKT